MSFLGQLNCDFVMTSRITPSRFLGTGLKCISNIIQTFESMYVVHTLRLSTGMSKTAPPPGRSRHSSSRLIQDYTATVRPEYYTVYIPIRSPVNPVERPR
jgi:hypothetical protein